MRCLYGKGIESRVIDKAVSIVSSTMELLKLFTADDVCNTTVQQVAEVKTLAHDMGELSTYYSGFDKKWDPIGAVEHTSDEEFEDSMNNFLLENMLTSGEILQMDLPKTIELFGTLSEELDFFTKIIEYFL